MALELSRLIKQVEHIDITLLAGAAGLNHLVSWVHMVESKEASSFLEGNEIAFCTGIGLQSDEAFLELLKELITHNAAGIVFNTGPYIESIPDCAIAYCEEQNFPLFVVPWKVHLAEIMRIFCFSITKEEQRQLETTSAFKNAIFFPKQEELYVVPLSTRNFHVNWHYSVCTIKINFPNRAKRAARMEHISNSLLRFMNHNYEHFALFYENDEIILVIAKYQEPELKVMIEQIMYHTRQLMTNGEHFCMGVGRQTKSVRCLYKSYHQSKAIVRLHQNGKIDESMIFYSDMGIYRLLMGIEDKEVIQEYYQHTLRPLMEYDKQNNSDLCMILRSYLKHDGSVKETADELFVHRNTINYKLKKAEELLNVELSSLNTRLQLLLAFMIHDMI